jgi:hypothetical protein
LAMIIGEAAGARQSFGVALHALETIGSNID